MRRIAGCCVVAALALTACGSGSSSGEAPARGPERTGGDPTSYLDRIATGDVVWAASRATSAGVVVVGGTTVDAESGSIRAVSDVALIEPDGSAIGLAPPAGGPLFHVQVAASPDGATVYVAGARCASGSLDRDTGRASCHPGGVWLGALGLVDRTWTAVAPPDDFPDGDDPTAVLLGTDAGMVLFTPQSDEGPRAAWTRSSEGTWTRADPPPFGWPCMAGGRAVSFNPRQPTMDLDEVQTSDDVPIVEVTYQVSVLDETTGTWSKEEHESVEAVTGSTSVGCTGQGLVVVSKGRDADLASVFTPGRGWRTTSLPGDAGGRTVVAHDTSLVLLKSASVPDLVFDPRSGDARPVGEFDLGALIAHVLDDGTVVVLGRGDHAAVEVLAPPP